MSVIHIDSSAFLRGCLADAADHEACRRLLTTPPSAVASSELLWLEADRAAIRIVSEDPAAHDLPNQVLKALSYIQMIPVSRHLINTARRIPQVIKSLDAIHVASAESLADALDCVITYDKTMTAVLQQRGIPAMTATGQ